MTDVPGESESSRSPQCLWLRARDGRAREAPATAAPAASAAPAPAAGQLLLPAPTGVMRNKDDPSTLFKELSIGDCREMIRDGVIAGGMIPKASRLTAASSQHRPVQRRAADRSPDLARRPCLFAGRLLHPGASTGRERDPHHRRQGDTLAAPRDSHGRGRRNHDRGLRPRGDVPRLPHEKRGGARAAALTTGSYISSMMESSRIPSSSILKISCPYLLLE